MTAITSIFRVIMTVEPAINLKQPAEFAVEGHYRVKFENVSRVSPDLATGMGITAAVKAKDIREAESQARGITNRYLSLFSYMSAASLPQPVIHRVYDVTPGKKRGLFLQRNYELRLVARCVRGLGGEEWKEAKEHLLPLTDEERDPLLRAMHLYRLGIAAEDLLVKYPIFWMGLEVINDLLREHYGLDIEYYKCDSCDRKTFPAPNGMRSHIERTSSESWGEFNRLRRDLVHGKQLVWDVVPRARVLVPEIENILRTALDSLMGLTERSYHRPLNLTNEHPGWYQSSATIEGPDLHELGLDTRFDLEIQEQEEGPRRIVPRPSIDPRFAFTDEVHGLAANEQVAVEFAVGQQG